MTPGNGHITSSEQSRQETIWREETSCEEQLWLRVKVTGDPPFPLLLLFLLVLYFLPVFLQVSLLREKKSIYLPIKSPPQSVTGACAMVDLQGDSGCDPPPPTGARSCFLTRPMTATVAKARCRRNSSGKDSRARKLTGAGRWGDRAAEFMEFCSGASGLSPYSSTNSRSRGLHPHLCLLSLSPLDLQNQFILQLNPSDSPVGLPPGRSGGALAPLRGSGCPVNISILG